jgi:hypothetical protein
LLLLIARPVLAQSSWKTYGSKECGYTAKFPGKPKEEFRSLKVDNGVLEYRGLTFEAKGYVFGITCSEINVKGSSDPEALLDAVRESAIEKLHATKGREMRILLQGNPGRLVELSAEGFDGFGEFVVVKGKFYQVLAIVESAAYKDRAKAFLKSFKLMPQ